MNTPADITSDVMAMSTFGVPFNMTFGARFEMSFNVMVDVRFGVMFEITFEIIQISFPGSAGAERKQGRPFGAS